MPVDRERYEAFQEDLQQLRQSLGDDSATLGRAVAAKVADYLSRTELDENTDFDRLRSTLRQLFGDDLTIFVERGLQRLDEARQLVNTHYSDIQGANVDVGRDFNRIRLIERSFRLQMGEYEEGELNAIIRSLREGAIRSEQPRQIRERIRKIGGRAAFYADTLAATHTMNVVRASKFEIARLADIDTFEYVGILRDTTREFCQEHLGNIYTLAEIQVMQNGQREPVFENGGGWNCIHEFEMAPDEEPTSTAA